MRGSPTWMSTPIAATTAATTQAAPGFEQPDDDSGDARPIACATSGRTIPSKPLTDWSEVSGTIAGSHAEYAA